MCPPLLTPAAPITIRPMTPADWPTLRAVRLLALAETPTAFYARLADEAAMSDEQWQARAREWSVGAGFQTFLAFDAAGEPCGVAAGVRDRGDPAVAVLISMWVAGSARRQGVGRGLMDGVLGWAKGNHYRSLDFEVTGTNDRARRFYESLGFAYTGLNSTHRHYPELTMLGMSKPLPPPHVRPLQPQEWQVFRELRIASIQDTPKAFGMSLAEATALSDEEWQQRTQGRTNADNAITLLGLDDSNNTVGIASGLVDESEPSTAKLLSMWVAPAHRRAGLAQAIIDGILTWARGKELSAMTLVVTENNGSAIKLYERLGFIFTGTDEPSRSHPPLRMLTMRRPL